MKRETDHNTNKSNAIPYWMYTGFVFLLLVYPVLAQSVRINEFMALNSSIIADEDGEYSDWIELFNDSTVAVNIQGWTLTDNVDEPQKWVLPDITMEPDEYLLIFASGKDRINVDNELHTNFKLNGDGEYLALFNASGNAVTEFTPAFPSQVQDVSFAYFDGDFLATLIPTPGEANISSKFQLLQEPKFSYEHGIYSMPFNLEITADLKEAQIYYTTNGNTPTASHGTPYTGAISISSTTVLRAILVKSDSLKSKVVTATYLFLDDIIHQPNNPDSYPDEWGSYIEIDGYATADYEMDPEITENPEYTDLLEDALLSIPTLSIVTDIGNLFSHSTDPDTGGIYIYTGPADEGGTELGEGWERPASVEYFNSDEFSDFQIDCGLRIHGGHSRRPEKTPKHSFRLAFRSEYGSSKLNHSILKECETSSFNTLVLRGGYGNTWLNRINDRRIRAQGIRDVWAKDSQLDMGHPSAHGTYVHLYLDGIYWGIYNPTERIDDNFAVTYFGGNEEDYDIIKDYNQVAAGNSDAWDAMMSLASAGLEENDSYQFIQGKNPDGTYNPAYEPYLDLVNFTDYMILNYYSGNWDWDHHNWIALRNHVNPDKGFRFFCWDAEQILETVNENRLETINSNRPTFLFHQLCANPEFRKLFADRVYLHLFNGGALTIDASAERYMERANEIEKAVIAESARWGDYRRDVHSYFESGPFDLYDKNYWLDQLYFLMNDYFPNRGNAFIQQLREAGLYPETEAPVFYINDIATDSHIIDAGDILSMMAPVGTIYYTTTGSDPVLNGSALEMNQIQFIPENQSKRVLIPVQDIGADWFSKMDYNDSDWLYCEGEPGGVGYEKGTGYENLISLDVSEMTEGENSNTSCFIRILFNTDTINFEELQSLELKILYDDGFRAYLNGQRIAERNAPPTLNWYIQATEGHEAINYETIDITNYINKLEKGDNLLTIHGLNYGITSSDFLINVKLIGSNSTVAKGSLSPDAVAYVSPIELSRSTQIKARTIYGGEWSALSERVFSIPDEMSYLKVTEIHYHPLPEDSISDREFEFIELKNTGESALDLSGFSFTDGITFTFPNQTVLHPGSFIVLSSNPTQFLNRYGFYAEGYDGNLNNGGEQIVGLSASGDTVINITYDDAIPWPTTPDGSGYSLVPVEVNPNDDQKNPSGWHASSNMNGSPGEDDPSSTKVEVDPIQPISDFYLGQNYPNPFNPITTISYIVGTHRDVPLQTIDLSVYNILGQKVETLIKEKQLPGQYSITWSAEGLASGIYFYRLKADNKIIETKKMMLIR